MKKYNLTMELYVKYKEEKSKQKFVDALIKNMKPTAIGFAGFKTRGGLQHHALRKNMFDNAKDKIENRIYNEKIIKTISRSTIKQCKQVFALKNVYLFIFPCFSVFVRKKMNGVMGESPYKNTILIFINPTVKGWKEALKGTITHEYAHAVTYHFHTWQTLRDSLFFEGLAENFVEMVQGKTNPWAKQISYTESKKFFQKLKKYLNSRKSKIYREIFFGSKKYPLWLGYSLGYYLVKDYTQNNKKSWKEIVKTSPQKVIDKSGF